MLFLKTCKSIPNGSAKNQNKLKYNSQTQKMTPNGRASREAKWVFATVASHLCLALFICHFIFLLFCLLFCSSLFLFFFLLFAPWLSKPWNQLALLPSLSLLFLLLPRLLLLLLFLLQISDGDGLCVILL